MGEVQWGLLPETNRVLSVMVSIGLHLVNVWG